MAPDKALQQTLDPSALFADVKSTSASSAAELVLEQYNNCLERNSSRNEPLANRDLQIWERVRLALSPPMFRILDNQLDTDTFMAGCGWMVGDVVTARKLFGRDRRGEIVRLVNQSNVGRPYKSKFFTKAALIRWGTGERFYAPSQLTLIERPTEIRKYFIAIYANDGVEGSGVRPPREFSTEVARKSAFPDWNLQDNIKIGLAAIALEGDVAVGTAAFEQTVNQADTVLSLHPEIGQQSPHSKAMVEIYRWLASAILGKALETATMDQNIDVLEHYCNDIPQGYWDIQGKCYYLETVMIAMLAGRMDKARELLKSKRSFRDIEDLRWVLKKLCRKTISPASDPEFVEKAVACLELLRRPFLRYHRDVSGHGIESLLLTALLERFLHSPGEKLNWHRVARAMFA